MRIVYCIAGTYNSGGMERVLANKANYLVSHGYEVFIITTDQRGKQPFFSLDERIRCYDLGINYEENNGKSLLNKIIHYPFKQWKHRKRLSELLRELRADIAISMFCNDEAGKYLKFIFPAISACNMNAKGPGSWQTSGEVGWMKRQ